MGRTSAISVSSLRFTLPSPIHFGYGVAYRASPGAKASESRARTVDQQHPQITLPRLLMRSSLGFPPVVA